MNKRGYFVFFTLVVLFSLLLIAQNCIAANPPASQTAGGIESRDQQMEKSRKLQKEIKTKKEVEGEISSEQVSEEDTGPKVKINTITVEGVSLLKESEINDIIAPFKGKELSLKSMQKIADLITDAYRQKGFVTSRAYIPPQTVKDGILIIKVIEGSLGSIEIKGNRFFKTSLLEKKIQLLPGNPFDYKTLQRSLTLINEHPDRKAKVTLVPGKEPGTTDILLDVKDNLPLHLGFEFDNYGSRFIDKHRFSLVLEENNLFGFDDKLYIKLQRSESDFYRVKNFRYLFPVTDDLEAGFYITRSHTKLGRDFEDLDSRGESDIYGIFLSKSLIQNPDLDLRLNLGFDYKDVKNYLLTLLNSEDRLRILKGGFDLDVNDKWGRTIFTSELNVGLPHIMGGMESKDALASRAGAGGKFTKGVFNLFRLQPMPFSSYILLKNQAQYSNYNLTATEEFQIGGPTSVRGYPAGEFSADKGIYSSIEWSFPPYFFPKDIKVPFTQDKFYDAFRTVLFYDWGTVHLNKVLTGDKQHRTLKSAGFGFRLNLSNDCSARIEFGYPLGKSASDGHNMQHWVEVITKF